MRFPLRAKFFVFATLIATAPLALVGQNLARIARDELKSAANEELTGAAGGLAAAFYATVEGRWLTPLQVIRNGIDSESLGLSQIADIVALQLTVDGSDLPILVTGQDFSQHLTDAGLDPLEVLRTPPGAVAAMRARAPTAASLPTASRRPATGSPRSPCRSAPRSPAAR